MLSRTTSGLAPCRSLRLEQYGDRAGRDQSSSPHATAHITDLLYASGGSRLWNGPPFRSAINEVACYLSYAYFLVGCYIQRDLAPIASSRSAHRNSGAGFFT